MKHLLFCAALVLGVTFNVAYAEREVHIDCKSGGDIVENAASIDSLTVSQTTEDLKIYVDGSAKTRSLSDIDSMYTIRVGRETGFTQTKDLELASASRQQGSYMSPVTTYKENIYLAYINSSNKMVITKKTEDGKTSETVLLNETMNDIYHVAPSLGIDKNGYIHVVGNMHNDSVWRYFVSDKPEDISSFTFLGDDPNRRPPEQRISYASFARDRNGELYLAFRFRFEEDWSVYPGISGGGVAKYDASEKTWSMLGGTTGGPDGTPHGKKVLLWTHEYGGYDDYYQSFKIRVVFDRTNRMHVATVFAKDPDSRYSTNLGTHVVYAYSDDGGETFHKAGGERIETLPITLDNGDIVVGDDWNFGKIDPNINIGVCANGIPVFTTFAKGGSVNTVRWDPSSGWGTPQRKPSGYGWSLVGDDEGVLTFMSDWNKFIRSYDDGETWTNNVAPEHVYNALWDYQYMHDHDGDLRYYTFNGSKVKVCTITFNWD